MAVVDYVTDFEEVDTAIFDKLSGCEIDGKPVNITFYSPDLDFRKAKYPMFVVYRVNEMPDFSRETSVDDYRDGEVLQNNSLYSVDVREPAEPWNVFYQVRLMTNGDTSHLDLNIMKMYFRKAFPLRNCYVTIKNVKYDVYHGSYQLTGSGYKDFGVTEEGDRKVTESYLLKVEINLDVHDRQTKQVVTEPLGIKKLTPLWGGNQDGGN